MPSWDRGNDEVLLCTRCFHKDDQWCTQCKTEIVVRSLPVHDSDSRPGRRQGDRAKDGSAGASRENEARSLLREPSASRIERAPLRHHARLLALFKYSGYCSLLAAHSARRSRARSPSARLQLRGGQQRATAWKWNGFVLCDVPTGAQFNTSHDKAHCALSRTGAGLRRY